MIVIYLLQGIIHEHRQVPLFTHTIFTKLKLKSKMKHENFAFLRENSAGWTAAAESSLCAAAGWQVSDTRYIC